MHRTPTLCILLVMLLHAEYATAQSESAKRQDAAYARVPKEIAFQNDSQWEDNRWQQADLGPFLAGTIAAGPQQTLKGLAIRVGDRGQAGVLFDKARLRLSAGWTGDFLHFDPRRFGLIRPPRAGGVPVFLTQKIAGWSFEQRFVPNDDEISSATPDLYKPGSSVSRLPKSWAHFQGFYPSGKRVVLSYTVGNTDVLESPWYVESSQSGAFTRTFHIGPSDRPLELLAADAKSLTELIADGDDVSIDAKTNRVTIAPRDQSIRFTVLILTGKQDARSIRTLRDLAGNPADLVAMCQSDSPRYPKVLTTQGSTSTSTQPYVIDTITLPFDNPYGALFFTAGHDFFSNGDAALCTVHGDVWTVSGIDRDLNEIRWRRFATGLCQPLGLKIVDDRVYVIGRDQITRLHDRNNDGEADHYENFNNDLLIAPRSHDYVTCLDTDPEGNFYFIHAKTGVMKVSADGSTLTSIADGFRNPNGMAVGPDGTITAAPQQGKWTPESSLIVVRPGGYYGFGGPRITRERPTGWDLPMCFIPRTMDNSGGAQVWVESDRWGPLAGQMLHLSFGQCRILLALTEQVDGVFQGGTVKLPTDPADFESGIMRGRFSPHDGQLYVSGLRGWQTRAIRDGCFQRLRYTGAKIHLPVSVETFLNGVRLSFTERLDRETAENPSNYFVEQWNYRYSDQYGSPDFKVSNPDEQGREEVEVASATLLDDEKSLFLEMSDVQPVNQLSISWLLRSTDPETDPNQPLRGTYAHTINRAPKRLFPESRIVRKDVVSKIPDSVADRLRPGLQFDFQSRANGETDSRVGRMISLLQPLSESPTPFLESGPFDLEISGSMKVPLSGFYQFRLRSNGKMQFWLNDRTVLETPKLNETVAGVLIQKGHNPFRIRFQSQHASSATLQLEWKGFDFDWEPIPPEVLFHDPENPSLLSGKHRRLGRQLFAENQCKACHSIAPGSLAMFELSHSAPDLKASAVRLNRSWVEQWILDPKSIRHDARMPQVLAPTREEALGDAADIAAFLTAENPDIESVPESSVVSQGEELFEVMGCLSCHHFSPSGSDDPYGRLSLHFTNSKFPSGALTRFLLSPTSHHTYTRMPDFQLQPSDARSLAAYIRSESKGRPVSRLRPGDPIAGRQKFSERGCANCHDGGEPTPALPKKRIGKFDSGCLAEAMAPDSAIPNFRFNDVQRESLAHFLEHDVESLSRASDLEASTRAIERLQCVNCHDRDGVRSHRMLVIAEGGSGKLPDPLPQLSWSGEKLRREWIQNLLSGDVPYKSRPWISTKMPAFPGYASVVADGLARQHGIDPAENESHSFDAEIAKVGEQLTVQSGLDCRQCHAMGDLQPRGDKDTKIALGINFAHIRDRMRAAPFERFLFNPARFDVNTKMIRLSLDGKSTKLKSVYDADAHRQFVAIWHYIQSLEE